MNSAAMFVMSAVVLTASPGLARNVVADGSARFAVQGESCGGDRAARCGDGLWCDLALKDCEPPDEEHLPSGICVVLAPMCPEQTSLVCGCDGKTYSSSCVRRNAQVTLKYPGQCNTVADEKLAKKKEKSKECAEKADRHFAMGNGWRFVLGGAKLKASGNVGNSTGKQLDGDTGEIIGLDEDETSGSIGVGYYEKSIARDLLFLAGKKEEYIDYCESGGNDTTNVLFWDAIKLDVEGGYGSALKEDGMDKDLEYDEKWRYSVGLSYEVPLEALFEGAWHLDPVE
jgi:hypothetical protein